MKHSISLKHVVMLLSLMLVSAVTVAGEPLVKQAFDGMDLGALPPGWTKAESPLLELVPEEGRGKVLKIANAGGKSPHLEFGLFDPAQFAGKTMEFSSQGKFPGVYVPIADNLLALPKLLIEAKDVDGKVIATVFAAPQAGKPDWQPLKKSLVIPANAMSVSVQLCVQVVDCVVFFDGLTITVTDAPAAPVAVAAPATPEATKPATTVAAKPVPPPTPPPPAVDPNSPEQLAAKAPKRSFDDGGMLFGPEFVTKLQKSFPSKSVTAGTALFIGPAYTEKSPLPKLSSAWHAMPFSPKLVGANGAPRKLLAALPEVLIKEKPEVVFIASDSAPGRKRTVTESDDWDDVARLCLRLGSLPVLVPIIQEGKDEALENILQSFKKAADTGAYLMVWATPADAFPKRADNLLKLLDIHVFARVKINTETGKPTTPNSKTIDE